MVLGALGIRCGLVERPPYKPNQQVMSAPKERRCVKPRASGIRSDVDVEQPDPGGRAFRRLGELARLVFFADPDPPWFGYLTNPLLDNVEFFARLHLTTLHSRLASF